VFYLYYIRVVKDSKENYFDPDYTMTDQTPKVSTTQQDFQYKLDSKEQEQKQEQKQDKEQEQKQDKEQDKKD